MPFGSRPSDDQAGKPLQENLIHGIPAGD